MLNHLVTLAASSAASDPWSGTPFAGFDANQRFTVLLVIVGCVTGAIVSLAGILYSALDAAHRRRTEANLKREMLDRGMSVDEVVKVIEAVSPPEDATGRWIASWCRGRK